MEKTIGVPSVKGMKGALIDGAVGAGGGILYGITRAIFGSGIIGSLAALILAGSAVKGIRGTALATTAGFMAGSGIFEATGGTQASSGAGTRGVM